MSEALVWNRLHRELKGLVDAVPAAAGVCVKDLTTGTTIGVNENELFPAASTIKIQILTQVLRRAELGELDLDRKVPLTSDVMVPGSGVIAYFEDLEELTVRDIAVLMIQVSDNTATNLCIDWATYEGTNALMRECGLEKSVLRRKMQDHVSVREGRENLTTPAEMAQFMDVLHKAEKLSPSVCATVLKFMKKWKRSHLTPGLPADAVLCSKTGGMDKVRNDVGIVQLQWRPYAICVFTKYGLTVPADQERFIAECARVTHLHMATLDVTSTHGQGVPAQYRSQVAHQPG